MLELKMLYLDKHLTLALERQAIIILEKEKYEGLGKSTIIEKHINANEKTLVIVDDKHNTVYKSSDLITFDDLYTIDKDILKKYDKIYVEFTIYSLETKLLLEETLHDIVPDTYVAGIISYDK